MVTIEKRSSAKSGRRQTVTSRKARDELRSLRATIMRLKRDHADLKREVAHVQARVSGALRPIDATFDEHDLQVMQEVQEGIAAFYRKSAGTR